MGTRSLTRFLDGSKPLTCVYRQMDGYPSGHGLELAKIIAPLKMVNGYSGGDQANGVGCLAAQVIANLKDGVGGVYIYPPDAKDVWEEYTYTISGNGADPLRIKVQEGKKKIFLGNAQEFLKFCQSAE